MSKLLDAASEQIQADRYGGFVLKTMAGYTPERIEWLWSNMLAKGMFHVFAGDSGIGKTLILINIAAILSRGGIFPGEKKECKPGKVVYLSGEDGLNHTIGPRLEAAGADMDQMIQLPPLNCRGKQFDLATELDSIADAVKEMGDVSLFIIDPVTSFCGGKFDNDSVTSVRTITTKLGNFAEKTGAAVIALQHLTKSTQNKMKNRILGSGAWVHGPRIVLGAIETSDGYRLFGKVKANITDTFGVYPFGIKNRDIAGIEAVHYVDWTDEVWWPSKLSEFEEGSNSPIKSGKSQMVHDILFESLSNGEWYPKQFLEKKVLSVVDVHDSTIKRCAEELGVQKRRTSETPSQTEWRLPS